MYNAHIQANPPAACKQAERLYPWWREFEAAKANTGENGIGQTTPVGMYPSGRNAALDVYDLSGNVWEWFQNLYKKPDGALDSEEADVRASGWRVVRGGSFSSGRNFTRAAYRNNNGFRVVVVCRSTPHCFLVCKVVAVFRIPLFVFRLRLMAHGLPFPLSSQALARSGLAAGDGAGPGVCLTIRFSRGWPPLQAS